MIRDIEKITRDLEDNRNNDIIFRKTTLEKMFYSDPDLLEILGQKDPRPLNKFSDPDNPTEEELKKRKEIQDYNEAIKHKQIIPYLKLNGLQDEVLNFVMFDIQDAQASYTNDGIKDQVLWVMCVVHQNDMDTQYGIVRTDLLSYIVRDLLCWTNSMGIHMKLTNDFTDIVDAKYYARTMKFTTKAPNTVNGHGGLWNKYDRYRN